LGLVNFFAMEKTVPHQKCCQRYPELEFLNNLWGLGTE
jgi:hypothetical protein